MHFTKEQLKFIIQQREVLFTPFDEIASKIDPSCKDIDVLNAYKNALMVKQEHDEEQEQQQTVKRKAQDCQGDELETAQDTKEHDTGNVTFILTQDIQKLHKRISDHKEHFNAKYDKLKAMIAELERDLKEKDELIHAQMNIIDDQLRTIACLKRPKKKRSKRSPVSPPNDRSDDKTLQEEMALVKVEGRIEVMR